MALFFAFYISGVISKPVKVLTRLMKKAGETGDVRLSAEDLASITEFAEVKDEVGQCIDSSAGFFERIGEIAHTLEAVSGGDLTAKVDLLSDNDVMGLSLKTMTERFNNMLSEINATSEKVSIGAEQVSSGSQSLAQGSTQQAASIEELSASIEDISQKAAQTAEMTNEASRLSDTIKNNAEMGNLRMESLVQAVTDINDAGQSISKVIKVIDDIAFQTNILALNAAVEAARAGAHGKGFAVVAEEVRNLAAKSAESAKDTSRLIEDTIDKAGLGLDIAHDTADSLKEIIGGINHNAEIIKSIAASSEEQAVAAAQITTGINQISQVVAQNNATAEESAAAAAEMSDHAALLNDRLTHFKLADTPVS
jgi:methyl-accepting chemotaxis protein